MTWYVKLYRQGTLLTRCVVPCVCSDVCCRRAGRHTRRNVVRHGVRVPENRSQSVRRDQRRRKNQRRTNDVPLFKIFFGDFRQVQSSFSILNYVFNIDSRREFGRWPWPSGVPSFCLRQLSLSQSCIDSMLQRHKLHCICQLLCVKFICRLRITIIIIKSMPHPGAYSRFHCPLPPFTILSPLPSWHQADVERPQVLFTRTKPSSSWSTGRSFPIAWQSRNNGS